MRFFAEIKYLTISFAGIENFSCSLVSFNACVSPANTDKIVISHLSAINYSTHPMRGIVQVE